jgi:signal recognition particle subunit SRP54
MTLHERQRPEIWNGSRRKRIAAGSGTTVQEVNQLMSQFRQMQKMMQMMKSGKGRGLFPGLPGLPRM